MVSNMSVFDVITIAGSPSAASRSSAVLGYARQALEGYGLRTGAISVRDLPPEDLVYGHFDSPAIQEATSAVYQARSVIVATPIYKAAYSGVLKSFLDLLPQKALAGKLVLPIATGGSPAHMLALDYALRPVLHSLGAQHTMQGVYILDSQIEINGASMQLDPVAVQRLDNALHYLINELAPRNGRILKELERV
jgi:FMN reductase